MKGVWNMKSKLMIFTLLAFVCIFLVNSAGAAVYGGDIIIESKAVMAGESFTVNVWLAGNDLEISSLRIPLKYDSQYLTCTYVDFGGSLKTSGMTGYSDISDGQVILAYKPNVIFPISTFSADSGLVATLYFTASADAPEVTVAVDSIYHSTQFDQFGTTFYRWNRAELADISGDQALLPTFEAGNIEVRRSTDVGDDISVLLPGSFALNQNYPNPFNPTTTISFSLPEKAGVRLEVFNVLGQSVDVLADEEYPAGLHQVTWDASDIPSGVYFYRISANKQTLTRKMLLLK